MATTKRRTPVLVEPGRPRTLHLVDADNLLGDPRTVDRRRIDVAFEAYRLAAEFHEGDQVVVATNTGPRHAAAVWLSWLGVTHRWRRGRDGADLELLDQATEAAHHHRFDRVVIGSGDRIFLEALDRLRAEDIDVDFVSPRASLARALEVRAAGHVAYLDDYRPAAKRRVRRRIDGSQMGIDLRRAGS